MYLVVNQNSSYELAHHGIKGQKWGVRRYQNEDGSLTELGKKRLNMQNDTNIYNRDEKINTAKKYPKDYRKLNRDLKKFDENKFIDYQDSYVIKKIKEERESLPYEKRNEDLKKAYDLANSDDEYSNENWLPLEKIRRQISLVTKMDASTFYYARNFMNKKYSNLESLNDEIRDKLYKLKQSIDPKQNLSLSEASRRLENRKDYSELLSLEGKNDDKIATELLKDLGFTVNKDTIEWMKAVAFQNMS